MADVLKALAIAVLLAPISLPAAAAEVDPHAHHNHEMMQMKRATRSTAAYALPRVSLVREDGKSVSLPEELDDGRPVAVNFIFTTCATICPLTSQIFSQLQGKLGSDRDKVQMASISIDPEQDTPVRLARVQRLSRRQDEPHSGHVPARRSRAAVGPHRRICYRRRAGSRAARTDRCPVIAR